MSKLFDGTYVRLDDDVSFQLVRTNPILTTNTKLVYDGEDLYMDAYIANPTLSARRFHDSKIKGLSPFNRNIRNFLLGTGDEVYDVYQNLGDTVVGDTFDDQFENMYWCGAESINSAVYPQELGIIAPLYLRKKLPNYFVIFKVPGPSNYNLNINETEDGYIDGEYSFEKDILKNATIIKTFDLRQGTVIGDYIRRYTEQKDFEFDKSIYANFSSKEITYYGIDKKSGVLTSKVEDMTEALINSDNTIMHDDAWITSGFRRNNLIFPYIFNLEFLFDDDTTNDYEFARYMGFYCNDIDLYDFEATYKSKSVTITNPEECVNETIVKSDDDTRKLSIIFDKENELSTVQFEPNTIYYIKDKFNDLHRVYEVFEDNEDTFSKSDSKLTITDKEFDFSKICGFETTSVSAYCERIEDAVGKAEFSFVVNKKFDQGETLYFYNNIYKKRDFIYEGEDEEERETLYNEWLLETNRDGYVIGEFVADAELPATEYVGYRFSTNGTIYDMIQAFCNAVNNIDEDHRYFHAYNSGKTVILKCIYSGSTFKDILEVDLDPSILYNKKISLFNDECRFVGGTDKEGCTFKVYADADEQFSPGRYLKTIKSKTNSIILSCAPYVNLDTEEIEPDYFEVSTDSNGVGISISNTSEAQIVDRFYPKFGVLSFFPIKDFDFDTLFSTYGLNTAFKEECEKLDEIRLQKNELVNGSKKGVVNSITPDNGLVFTKSKEHKPVKENGDLSTYYNGYTAWYNANYYPSDSDAEKRYIYTTSETPKRGDDVFVYIPNLDSSEESNDDYMSRIDGEVSKIISIDKDTTFEDEEANQYNLSKLAKSPFRDDDGNEIETEYEYFVENLIPELCTVSKVSPYINKWGYYDEQKDSCENPYRLNTSKIFGPSNLSANPLAKQSDIDSYTHSMPYYVTNLDVLSSTEDEEDGESDISLYSDNEISLLADDLSIGEMDYLNEYQYVYDACGVYNKFKEERNSNTSKSEQDIFIDMWINTFMDTTEDNFDKLFITKTDEHASKRFCRKYSRFKFGNDMQYSNTLFRGVKFNVKKIIDGIETYTNTYNDYKFSFVYIPIDLHTTYYSNKVHFVKNDTFKFIVGMVFFNTLSGIDANSLKNIYDISNFSKAFVYGGCYGILSTPKRSNYEIASQITDVNIDGLPLDDICNYYKEDGYIDVSVLDIKDDSIRLMFNNLNSADCVKKIVIHNASGTINKSFTNIRVDDNNIIYISNIVKSTRIKTDNSITYIDFVIEDRFTEDGTESLLFKDYYAIFEKSSIGHIKDCINNDDNVAYYTTGDDVFKLEIENPAQVFVYDVLMAIPQTIMQDRSKTDLLSVSAITTGMKTNVRKLSLMTLNRYSGYYNPICTDIVMFNDLTENEYDDTKYKFSNVSFDTDYKDNYGEFGVIKNMFFHKISEKNSNNIVSVLDPYYPATGQYTLDSRDYNIFSSSWDMDYFTEQIDTTHKKLVAGTYGMKNSNCMFGSKYMNVPEYIYIDTFNSATEWQDDYLSDPTSTDHEIMFNEVNGNSVEFFLFLKKRIIRYFIESDLRYEFIEHINPSMSYGDKTSLVDDIEAYVEKNILKLYKLDKIKVWVKRKKKGIHDSKIENDYQTYISYDDNRKSDNNMHLIDTFNIQSIDADMFNKKVSYNLRTGYEEDFAFSFRLKKI